MVKDVFFAVVALVVFGVALSVIRFELGNPLRRSIVRTRIKYWFNTHFHADCSKGKHSMKRNDYLFYEFDEDTWHCERCGHTVTRTVPVSLNAHSGPQVQS